MHSLDRVVVRILFIVFFFQAEDGIRGLVRSRGLGDVYKRQAFQRQPVLHFHYFLQPSFFHFFRNVVFVSSLCQGCLLYTSDAADDLLCVDLGGRSIIKTKKNRILHIIYPHVTNRNPYT